MRPRLRDIRAACEIISSVLADAVMMTASAPMPSVRFSTNFTGSSPCAGLQVMMPFWAAMANFCSSKSTPTTRQPFTRRSSAVNKPINPKPTTTTVSPRVGLSNRTPCKPMEPITVKAAWSSVTLSGIFDTKFLGTQTTSACWPLEATRSPICRSIIPSPTATTSPTLQ